MLSSARFFAVSLSVVMLGIVPALATESLAEPWSDIDKIGQALIAAAAGRTLEEAEAETGSADNPFSVDIAELLAVSGLKTAKTGAPDGVAEEGELSIYLRPVTPVADFDAAKGFSDILPFAFRLNGVCRAGYVSGYPAPKTVYKVDLGTGLCHAGIVVSAVTKLYTDKATPIGMPITIIAPSGKCVDQSGCLKATPRPVSPPTN